VAVLSQLGGLEQARGRSDTALRHHARARRLLEEHGLEGTLIEAAVLNNLAISQRANGEPQAARESLERARRILAGRPDGPRRLSVAVSSNFGVLATGP
jgi:Flp pilus assembly protein TadD